MHVEGAPTRITVSLSVESGEGQEASCFSEMADAILK
jgi:hypothetical protein